MSESEYVCEREGGGIESVRESTHARVSAHECVRGCTFRYSKLLLLQLGGTFT